MKEKVQLELKIISFRNSSSLKKKKKKKGNKFLSQQYQTSFILDILTQQRLKKKRVSNKNQSRQKTGNADKIRNKRAPRPISREKISRARYIPWNRSKLFLCGFSRRGRNALQYRRFHRCRVPSANKYANNCVQPKLRTCFPSHRSCHASHF